MNNNININKSNYENYVIDYLDGNLTAIENDCFVTFLKDNPAIKEEIFDLDNIELIPEKKEFSEKDTLKKKPIVSVSGINELNYEEYFIAHFEGNLNESQTSSLLKFTDKNPDLSKEFKLHSSLQLIPDKNIVFSDKSVLKHKSNLRPIWYSSAAAILILFATGWFILNQEITILDREITLINQITTKEISTSLSLAISTKVKIEGRQIAAIKVSESNLLDIDIIKLTVAEIESKDFNDQLVNAYDFARLAKQREIDITPYYTNYEGLIVMAEPVDEKPQKSLFAKIFSNQKEKIFNSFKIRRSNKSELTEPAYIQVLNRSLLVFNTLTGSETSTVKTYNTEGELTSFQIEGQEVLLGRNSSAKLSQ